MTRFCSALALQDPAREVARMGAAPVFCDTLCALGALPGGPRGVATLYRDGSLVAVGEVTLFNRSELLHMLPDASVPPPASDGEVLLRYFAQHGPAGLARVNGMFALAIWDGSQLVLARDAVGARTLFYSHCDGYWAAASSLRALRRWPRLPARLNLAAVRSFLTFAYLPGKDTLLEGVYELLPGCWVSLSPNQDLAATPVSHYWEPCETSPDPPAPAETYTRPLRRLLEAATAARLPQGEAVGVFLSGGLDSSLVTALTARLHQGPVHTYSISFGVDAPNELAYSGLVAQHCRTHHHILSFTGRQIAAHLAEAVGYLDCPVGDPLTVPNLLLARAAAVDGLRVILNGEGGDPVFGGPKNLPMLMFELHRTDPTPTARAAAYLHAYRKCYDELPRLLTPAALHSLQDAAPLEPLVQTYLESDRMRAYLNRLLYTNLRTKGAHHILTKVERLTAACGLEGRSPLFDLAVVDYSFAIPPQYKLAGTSEKWILKEAARDLLPATIIDRPKSGMRVPVQQWLRGPLRELAWDLLLSRQTRARDLFRVETIQTWLRGEGMLWPRQGGMLWLILTLELWLRAYLDRAELDLDKFVGQQRRSFMPGWQWH